MSFITGISIGIGNGKSSSDQGVPLGLSGHLYYTLGWSDGSSTTLEAGPINGSLQQTEYQADPPAGQSNDTITLGFSSPQVTADIGAALLNAASNYNVNAGDAITYTPGVVDSNAWSYGLGEAAGITPGALDMAVSTLQQNSGLTAVAANPLDAASLYDAFFASGSTGGPASNMPPDPMPSGLDVPSTGSAGPDLGAGLILNDPSGGFQISGGDASTPGADTVGGSAGDGVLASLGAVYGGGSADGAGGGGGGDGQFLMA